MAILQLNSWCNAEGVLPLAARNITSAKRWAHNGWQKVGRYYYYLEARDDGSNWLAGT